ncbi:aspartate 1-decarboxylase [candidate division KSB1 bacterium RBG_16_48_16]|nr:MAG: aspartate 1-decarboxylase [candidate division KSB1 bacterium RBG_16_48_16]
MCKSKIHRARVTDVNLDYEGSLTVDKVLLRAADIAPYEKVQVLNINNGTRAETYIIEGSESSGQVVVNGALARWAQKDDLVIIIAYAMVDETEVKDFSPKLILVDERNNIVGNA